MVTLRGRHRRGEDPYDHEGGSGYWARQAPDLWETWPPARKLYRARPVRRRPLSGGRTEAVRAAVWMVAALVVGVLWWRRASRRHPSPCPTWAAWVLDNPLTEALAGTQTTFDRIGLRPGERALDVGSGPGRLAIPAARRVGPSGAVVALDVQPGMLARLQRRAALAGVTAEISPRLGDIATDVELPPGSFDRAWLVTVLGEIPERRAALRNLYRILKPGGTLSITEIFGDPHYQRRAVVARLCVEAGFEPTQRWGTALAYTQNFIKPHSDVTASKIES